MAAEKTLAIILRVVDFSETSCILNLFTRDFGKIGVLAKGARRRKSPFEGAIDLLTVCRIVFLHKSNDSLDLLTEAKLERRFRSATKSLSRLYSGYYIAELLNLLTHDGDPYPELYDLAYETLGYLDSDSPVFESVIRFEMKCLAILGHHPMLGQCVGCGADVGETERIAFSQLAGGVLCRACRVGQRQVISVRGETIRLMLNYSKLSDDEFRSYTDSESPKLIPHAYRGELRAVLNHYMNHLLGRQPKLQKWLVNNSL